VPAVVSGTVRTWKSLAPDEALHDGREATGGGTPGNHTAGWFLGEEQSSKGPKVTEVLRTAGDTPRPMGPGARVLDGDSGA